MGNRTDDMTTLPFADLGLRGVSDGSLSGSEISAAVTAESGLSYMRLGLDLVTEGGGEE